MRNEIQATELGRRRFMAMAGATALLGVIGTRFAHADQKMLDEALSELLGDKSKSMMETSSIKLDLPEIAENGNTVPINFEVQSPMSADNYVKSVHVFAEGNPRPEVASFHFTPASGRAAASTRMRLAKTQNVMAVAELSDGKIIMAKKQVKVTIGGCGG